MFEIIISISVQKQSASIYFLKIIDDYRRVFLIYVQIRNVKTRSFVVGNNVLGDKI